MEARKKSVVVMGGGVAGMATALLLARDGHRVTLLERDAFEVGDADTAPEWERKGIPHFLQPHAFIPRGRVELRAHLPDVYEDLLDAGAQDVDVRRALPGELRADDEDLQYIGVRRPVLEWGLRRAVAREPAIDVRARVAASGLRVEHGRVIGVGADGGLLDADLVVDALGRRTPTGTWLQDSGATADGREESDCGVIYYSRYYRVRDGFELPGGPWILSPRGDLGYLGYASFPGDNGTFAALLAVPNGVAEWRAFHDTSVFEAAIDRIPMLRLWVDPDGVEPITGVLPMAGLKNTLRHYGPSSTSGLAPIGDAFSHTDPVLAHGLSFALIHARELATALRDNDDVDDACAVFAEATKPALQERFDFATQLDDQRHRMWTGEPVDIAHRDGAYALFSFVAAGAVAMVDPDVFRVFVRRIGLLDSTAVLDGDEAMQRHIEDRFQQILSSPRPPGGPSREEMVALTSLVGETP